MSECKHPTCGDECRRPVSRWIKPASEKRAALNKELSGQVKAYKKKNSQCQVMLQGCSKITTDVHHMRGRLGSNLMDERYWIAVCRNCHRWIEEHPKAAKKLGFSTSRFQ